MTKSHEDVVKNWKIGKDSEGSSMFSEGRVIYSYGRHFPIAIKLDDGHYLFNKDKYSKTTSQHQTLVRRAIPENNVTELDTEDMREVDRKNISSMKELVTLNL